MNTFKKQIMHKFLVGTTLFSLLFIVIFFAAKVISVNLKETKQNHTIKASINAGSSLVRHDFENISTHLTFLLSTNNFISYLKTSNENDREKVEVEFLNLIKTSHLYDQIRYIDETGMEKVRVDYLNHNPKVVPQEKLQNKKNRYYYQETATLQGDEIFVSPLDLNKENGEIEIPYKPVIRFAQVVRNQDNEFKGIIILNYLASHFLDKIKAHLVLLPGRLSLLNEQGFWLISSIKENEWGFMLGQNKRFSVQYPDAWSKIKNDDLGIVKTDRGQFSFSKVNAMKDVDRIANQKNHSIGNWKIVVMNDPQKLSLAMFLESDKVSVFLIIIYFIGLYLIFIWAKASTGKSQVEVKLKTLNMRLEAMVIDRTQDLVKKAKELEATKSAVIVGMASLAEIRDPETGFHLKRTQEYVRALAIELRKHPDFENVITDNLISMYVKTAPLHDIGKVGVPDAILLKPGPLTKEEFEVMKGHPSYGAQIIETSIESLRLDFHSKTGLEFLTIAKELIEGHHEKWDGSGYPRGLIGNDIPLSARVMALADVFDALSTKRPYKAAFDRDKVEMIILEGKGTHFDPRIIDAFVSIKEEFWSIKSKFCEDDE